MNGLVRGTRLGVFEILDAIGAGAMGEVYRARDTRLGRDVAIKILPAAFTSDVERVARFGREARLLASLHHPNIATIHGIEESGKVQGLVLELVDGETLAGRIAGSSGGRVPVTDALNIARQIADALDAAHQRGVVHRDLKPANIKITRAGVVKVLDFGLAKTVAAGNDVDSATATREGVVVGTAAYMSPEQARGQDVDKRTDIWAFGCVLYEMLAGQQAFGRATIWDTTAAVLHQEPDWTACPPWTPPVIVQLLRHCLQRDPHRRLRDVADARLDLADAVSSPLTPAAGSATKPARSTQLTCSAVGVIVGGAMTAGLLKAMAPAIEPTLTLSQPRMVTNSAAQEFGPAVSPDGSWVAYYAHEQGRTDLWVKFLESGATKNLTAGLALELPGRTGIGGVAISPNGREIAFTARTGPGLPSYDTFIMPAPVGGPAHKLVESIHGMQWSADGKQIVLIRPRSTGGDSIVVGNTDASGLREIVPTVPGRHLHWLAWSPDGAYVYFINTYDTWHSEPSDIYRVPAAGGPVEPVVQARRRAVYPVPLGGGGLMFAGNAESLDLGLWWQPPIGAPRALTSGFGEYTEPRLSANGRLLVATLVDVKDALMTLPVTNGPAQMVPLTDGHTGDIDPTLDPHTDRLVFSSARTGHRSLWIARADGGDPRPLTNDSAIDERPAFSPDGRDVAFVSNRSGRQGIWMMSASGGAPILLAETTVLDSLTWSRDRARVIFARPERDRTALAAVTVATRQVDAIPTPAGACCPAASPTDDVIAYLQPTSLPPQGPTGIPGSRLWLRFIDSAGRRLYPDLPDQPPGFPNGYLAWAPDGKRLAGAAIAASSASSLTIIEPESRSPYRKLIDLPVTGRPRGFTWTRDGNAIILGNRQAPSDIVLFDVQGLNPQTPSLGRTAGR